MKTPEYHNPQQVPKSALKPGERFLLREEIGDKYERNCTMYYGGGEWGPENGAMGAWFDKTYKTTLPLPPVYRDPDYGDPEYRKGVEQAFRDGKRVQWANYTYLDHWRHALTPTWNWIKNAYRINPDDDWTTADKQAEALRMWANNPTMERDWMPKTGEHREWSECQYPDSWSGNYYYRPAQKPREMTQWEKNIEFARDWVTKFDGPIDFDALRAAVLAGINYAREASRKGALK